jgi:hypothetical protein
VGINGDAGNSRANSKAGAISDERRLAMMKIFIASVFILISIVCTSAQTVATDDTLSWNDVQFTVPINKQLDFFLQGTFRFGKNITRLNEHRAVFGFVYKPNKTWSFQPSYLNINARNSSGRFRLENRLAMRVSYHFPFKKFDLYHRSLFELRLRNPRNSWRYRPSLTLEKDIKKIIPKAKIFLTEEVFYDSILEKFSRNRFSVGITKTLSKKLSLDVYYLRQNDGYTRPGDLHVIGTNWKFKF